MKKLTDREADVMTAIWESPNEKVSTGEILKAIKQAQRNALQTLQVILKRLVTQGFIVCEKARQTNLYTAIISQEDYLDFATNNFILHHYPNLTPDKFIIKMVRTHFNRSEIEELLQMIDMKN